MPANTELISHQLMLRTGMIRKLASGLYIWLPTGIRVLEKIKAILREEMSRIGAIEISMPIVQPVEMWRESGRWTQYGPELLTLKDRRNRSFVLGPTHEEIITVLMRDELNSYKQLPINLYQIQTKFRDELRPRFGVIRSREFIMKDGYSFHLTDKSLQKTYKEMQIAYSQSLKRMGLNFCIVQATTGSIGGNLSHEFQVLAKNGEDKIVLSSESNFAANIDKAEAMAPIGKRPRPLQKMILFDTPGVQTIEDLINQYNLPIEQIVKTLFIKAVKGSAHSFIAMLLRGDHHLNKSKAEELDIVTKPLEMATEKEIKEMLGVSPGSLGPVGLTIPVIADRTVAKMGNFCAGANIDGKHLKCINWGRDLPEPRVEDIRNVVEGDPSPDGQGILRIERSIEVGHIFQLGYKYTHAMKAKVQDEKGVNKIITMGCYGIGITRLIAAAIEQKHDERGIIWPVAIAPFKVAILPIYMHKFHNVKILSEEIYQILCSKKIDVIMDDREESPGTMFTDIELIGIPHIIIISKRNLENEDIEYKSRLSGKNQFIKRHDIVKFLINIIK
ncbi:proline--tRNA ligase [Pantoea sp. Mhis]|nr:proline--tRNA ligase [Pantoea sp. Mhis]